MPSNRGGWRQPPYHPAQTKTDMADLCQTCTIETWGFDTRNLAGLTTQGDTAAGNHAVVLCEGCGLIQVDHDGKRVERLLTPAESET